MSTNKNPYLFKVRPGFVLGLENSYSTITPDEKESRRKHKETCLKNRNKRKLKRKK